MKSPSVGGELFHADRRTDMAKLIVAFRNFANAPNERNFIAFEIPYIFLLPNSPQWDIDSSFTRLYDHTEDTPHSVGLLWTSDQAEAETST
jgi:hypothetical protein